MNAPISTETCGASSLHPVVRRWSDCFDYGCGYCRVCTYLDFIDWALGCAPPGQSMITRDPEMEAYLKLPDAERRALPYVRGETPNDQAHPTAAGGTGGAQKG